MYGTLPSQDLPSRDADASLGPGSELLHLLQLHLVQAQPPPGSVSSLRKKPDHLQFTDICQRTSVSGLTFAVPFCS